MGSSSSLQNTQKNKKVVDRNRVSIVSQNFEYEEEQQDQEQEQEITQRKKCQSADFGYPSVKINRAYTGKTSTYVGSEHQISNYSQQLPSQ